MSEFDEFHELQISRNEWESFVERHPLGNIFQSPSMYDAFRDVQELQPGLIVQRNASNQVCGILLYCMISQPGLKRFFSRRAVISGGPLTVDNDPSIVRGLLDLYLNEAKRYRAIYTEVRNLFNSSYSDEAFAVSGFIRVPHLAVHIDLTNEMTELQSRLHKGRLSNIRRARKKGVRVRIDVPFRPEHALLIKKTYNRINVPQPPPELFSRLWLKMRDQLVIAEAVYEEKMIACRVYVKYKDVIYDWYAASDSNYFNLCANDLLPWEVMMWAKEKGIKTYDFAGGGNPAKPYRVRDYKLRFGAEVYDFGRYKKIHRPFLYSAGSLMMRTFQLFRKPKL
jgi:serine/alanine adding enzyme